MHWTWQSQLNHTLNPISAIDYKPPYFKVQQKVRKMIAIINSLSLKDNLYPNLAFNMIMLLLPHYIICHFLRMRVGRMNTFFLDVPSHLAQHRVHTCISLGVLTFSSYITLIIAHLYQSFSPFIAHNWQLNAPSGGERAQ